MINPIEASADPVTIGVVVPVRNAQATIQRCLDAIFQATGLGTAKVSVVVVDNGSTDLTVDFVRRYGTRLSLLRDPGRTVGGLRNLGAAASRTQLLAFVDADCVVAPNYFEVACRSLVANRAAAIGYPYALPDAPGWIETAWDRLHRPASAGPAAWLYAGNLVIRRKAFEAVGGFNDTIRTGEDPELGRRLRLAGLVQFSDPALVAVHLGNPQTLRAFFRQQRWHGLGAVGTGGKPWTNRPLIMTFGHGIASLMAGLSATSGFGLGLTLSMLVGSQLIVPAATVVFRIRQTRRWSNPCSGVLLYWLYYWARLAALGLIASGRLTPKSGR